MQNNVLFAIYTVLPDVNIKYTCMDDKF